MRCARRDHEEVGEVADAAHVEDRDVRRQLLLAESCGRRACSSGVRSVSLASSSKAAPSLVGRCVETEARMASRRCGRRRSPTARRGRRGRDLGRGDRQRVHLELDDTVGHGRRCRTASTSARARPGASPPPAARARGRARGVFQLSNAASSSAPRMKAASSGRRSSSESTVRGVASGSTVASGASSNAGGSSGVSPPVWSRPGPGSATTTRGAPQPQLPDGRAGQRDVAHMGRSRTPPRIPSRSAATRAPRRRPPLRATLIPEREGRPRAPRPAEVSSNAIAAVGPEDTERRRAARGV